ncbi:PHP domain-containing protein [Halococcus morrhuae DSM 1307]|uniref:PHP domain-containing protein n=1 Tax=Halococcus morrhuae DSM 1307 TaxID=931277 RepID=M0MCC0_HALMO|nr:PHP domain-containing protein [Halococcus morrhuae]EMA42983.1 PHP domain-containing protein [Halococcus morrhuae DSM 1307]
MPVADLHVHTTNSDGRMALADVPDAARTADVGVVAITDHERLHPDLETPIDDLAGTTAIHGIELRVETESGQVDLLGYGVAPTAELRTELDRLQNDRIERGRAIIDCVEERLDCDLALEPTEGIGRPHIARAIARSDADYDYEGAFAEVIGNDCPCFVARDLPTFERGAALLANACGVVSLAHPLRYGDPEAALALAASDHVDAVERYYDYGRPVDVAPVTRAIERHGLLETGGSDAHDDVLGRAGLDGDEYDAFRERLAASLPEGVPRP